MLSVASVLFVHFLIFKIYLSENQTVKERETHTHTDLPSISLFPNDCKARIGMSQSSAGTGASSETFLGGRDSATWAISCCFLRLIIREHKYESSFLYPWLVENHLTHDRGFLRSWKTCSPAVCSACVPAPGTDWPPGHSETHNLTEVSFSFFCVYVLGTLIYMKGLQKAYWNCILGKIYFLSLALNQSFWLF